MEEVVDVPHDILFNHILTKVPAKSIGRFMCVSKEWRSFLTSDMFQNKHIHHHQNNIKLVLFSKSETTSSSFEFTTIDCEAPPSDDAKGFTPTRRPLPQFTSPPPPHDIHLLTSFHGLICLGIINVVMPPFDYSHLILWNPLTHHYKRLSKSVFGQECQSTHCSKFGLYYSSCEDDYKLLLVKTFGQHVYIYSLKSDSWRRVDASQTLHLYWDWSRPTFLNDNLYFLQHHHNNKRLTSILRFDTKAERLSNIETPDVIDGIPNAYNYVDAIVVKSGCIHVCVKYDINITCNNNGSQRTTCIKLWKLDEYGNMKQVLTYQLRPQVYDIPISSLRPFYLMKNGNWLMIKNWWSSYRHQIYKVDLKKNEHNFESAEVRVDGNNNIVLEEGRYIETFVSPNRYMK